MKGVGRLETSRGTNVCGPLNNSQIERYKVKFGRLEKNCAKGVFELCVLVAKGFDQCLKHDQFAAQNGKLTAKAARHNGRSGARTSIFPSACTVVQIFRAALMEPSSA